MRTPIAGSLGAAVLLLSSLANAHISVISGPGFANTSQEITFGVAHGCAGADTYSVTIDIPQGVTSVRTETSDFGKASVATDATGAVTAVTWQKADADVLLADTAYYKLTMRVKVPNAPFTAIYFPAHQVCKDADGGVMPPVDWVSLTPTAPDGGSAEPAPMLVVLPARKPGWNKFTVPAAVADLSTFFGDALIVWKGEAAFSGNAPTADLIKTTSGVTPLTMLAAGDEVWVKY